MLLWQLLAARMACVCVGGGGGWLQGKDVLVCQPARGFANVWVTGKAVRPMAVCLA
jgi:hypothetical protein